MRVTFVNIHLKRRRGRGVYVKGFHATLMACHVRKYAGAFPLVDAVALWSGLVVEDLAWTESKEL